MPGTNVEKLYEDLADILLASIREYNESEVSIDELVNKNMKDESFANIFIEKLNKENRNYQPNRLHNSKYV